MDGVAPYYIGVDIGTSQSKGVIMDQSCRIVHQASVDHTMEHPQPGFYEHDAQQVWWGDFCILSRRLLEESGIDPAEIAGVGGSTLGSDCLPVDEACRPLRKAILYGIDARAQEEIRWLEDYYGPERVRELFGRPICSGDVAPKILWIKRHEPEVYARTYKFLTGSSYLTAKLTGEYVVDQFLGQASFRPLYRPDGTIREEECGLYCRPEQLAQTRQVHAIAGYVTEQAAQETGLRPGTPVITGTGDSSAEAISTGVLAPGDMLQTGKESYNSNAQQRLNYVTDTLLPYVVQWESEDSYKLTGPLLRQTGAYVHGNVEALLRADPATRADFYVKLIEHSVMCPDDARAKEELNPIPGGLGKQFLISKNLGSLESVLKGEEGNG